MINDASELKSLTWTAFGGFLFFILFGSISYLYSLTVITKLFNKLGRKPHGSQVNPNSMLLNNILLFIISIILTYFTLTQVSEFSKGIPVYVNVSHSILPMIKYFISEIFVVAWALLFVFCIAPIMLLSFSYLVTLGTVYIFLFLRHPRIRIFFWILIFFLWTLGSLMLLIKAMNS